MFIVIVTLYGPDYQFFFIMYTLHHASSFIVIYQVNAPLIHLQNLSYVASYVVFILLCSFA